MSYRVDAGQKRQITNINVEKRQKVSSLVGGHQRRCKVEPVYHEYENVPHEYRGVYAADYRGDVSSTFIISMLHPKTRVTGKLGDTKITIPRVRRADGEKP